MKARRREEWPVVDRRPVVVVIGTRPEAIKMFPVVLALRESEHVRPIVVTTGQHRDLVAPVLATAGIEADVDLAVGRPALSVNDLVMAVMAGVADLLARLAAEEPDDAFYPAAVLVHGDTSSAMAAALAAFHTRVPVVHVEAGLRTRDPRSPFPEEMNRQLIGRLAVFHLAPTIYNAENLVRERVPHELVFVTGNTAIDALQWTAARHVPFTDPRVAELDASDRRVVVVTAHRRENWGAGIAGIAAAVRRLAAAHPEVGFVWPVHPNPRVSGPVREALGEIENVVLTDPLPYGEFARLLARAYLSISDSGGVQEEGPAVGTPVLVARESSERLEGVDTGALRLVGTDPDVIVGAAEELFSDPVAYVAMTSAPNPFGDGRAAARIVAALEHIAVGTPEPTQFGSGFSRSAVLEAAGYGEDVTG
jgi:UDP-N-acetylglucosamine 2-epimerase (non-hydrolysing)